MFEETPITPPEERDPIEALSGILEKFEQRPLLKKIEKNTAVLPTLLRALTLTKGAKAAHLYLTEKSGKPLKEVTERLRGTKSPVAVRERTPRTAQGASVRAAARNVTPATPAVPSPVSPATPIVIPATTAPATPRRAAPAPARNPRTPRPPANAGTPAATTQPRAANGRFGSGGKPGEQSAGQKERDKQRKEEPVKGLKGWFKAAFGAVLGKGKEKEGDIQDAAGKAIGGPIWEAAKEMQGAVGELKEKLQDDKTLLGKSAKWAGNTKAGAWLGKKTGLFGTGRNAVPTEGAEQRRHRELIQTIEGNGGHGGGGGGGAGTAIAEAIGGGTAGAVGGTLISRIPGVSIAQKVLAKAGPVLSVLAAGTTLAAVGAISVAAAGFAGIMGIVNKGTRNGWSDHLDSSQTKALTPQGPPSEAEKKKWQDGMKPQGNVVSAVPGATTTVDANGNMVKRTGDRNWRNNNPGNIEYGPFAKSQGATGSDGRFAVFPDYKAGRTAMKEKLFNSDDYKGKSLSGAISSWAPVSDGNNTAAYQKAVLAAVGGKDRKMSDYSPAEQQKILDAMQKQEGFRKGQSQSLGAVPQNGPTVVPAQKQVKSVPQPTSLQELAPAPLTAQLMGTEKLVAALNKQAAPSKETASLAPIKPHYDDTVLTLMAHDRI